MKEKTLPIKEAKKKFIKRSFYCGVLAILICWFMKLFGFDYFGLDLENKFFNDLDSFFVNQKFLKDVFITILLNVQLYFMVCIVNKEQGFKPLMYIIKTTPITIIYRLITIFYQNNLGNILAIIDIVYLTLITSKMNKNKILKSIVTTIFITIYQIISLQTRSLNIKSHNYNFVVSQILSIDFYILLYLNKELEVNVVGNDGTFIFFGLTAWLYYVAGFIVGLFKLHPIKTAKEWYEKGKAKEDARKTKKELKSIKK